MPGTNLACTPLVSLRSLSPFTFRAIPSSRKFLRSRAQTVAREPLSLSADMVILGITTSKPAASGDAEHDG